MSKNNEYKISSRNRRDIKRQRNEEIPVSVKKKKKKERPWIIYCRVNEEYLKSNPRQYWWLGKHKDWEKTKHCFINERAANEWIKLKKTQYLWNGYDYKVVYEGKDK